jgi:hypothetical protein
MFLIGRGAQDATSQEGRIDSRAEFNTSRQPSAHEVKLQQTPASMAMSDGIREARITSSVIGRTR